MFYLVWPSVLHSIYEMPRKVFQRELVSQGFKIFLSLDGILSNKLLTFHSALMSPWLDLTTSSPSWLKNFDHDFLPEPSRMYTLARYYTPDHMRLADPRISPIFADLSGTEAQENDLIDSSPFAFHSIPSIMVSKLGLPPIFVQVSTTEQVYDDTAWLEAKAKSHNVEITVDAFKNLPHVFQAFRIPQAQQVKKY